MEKINNKLKIGIIGLGYVGLPLAISFSSKYVVKGLDIDTKRINELINFNDKTLEVESKILKKAKKQGLTFTSSYNDLSDCTIYIITVPTPINNDKTPDLSYLENSTKEISKILKKNDIVIYESTVYPGCTEEFCVPILESYSKLKYNHEFFCGYSPERINPGDKVNTLENIVKVTSGSTQEISKYVDDLYSSIIKAGTHRVGSLKIAEASKAIENAQRDLNISFMNELALIFDLLKIDTNEVIEAASTKWNFLPFKPGLVGGHCISVDPYYLVYKAKELGYSPNVIMSGRKVNDNMGTFIADKLIKSMKIRNIETVNSSVLILGITYKENSPDIRNTKIPDIYNHLVMNKINVSINDPIADADKVFNDYKIRLDKIKSNYDAIVLAVPHMEFLEIDFEKLKSNKESILFDVKSVLRKELANLRL